MKRIVSFFLAAVLLLSAVSMGTSAAGTLLHSDDFIDGFKARNWILNSTKFSWDKAGECIYGYGDAIVLETNYDEKYGMWWDKFYASMDFQIRGRDNIQPSTEDRPQTVSIWYRDLMADGGAIYMYTVEIETGKVFLHKYYDFSYYDEYGNKQNGKVDADIAEGDIGESIKVKENAPWYNFGIRVLEGKIECYFNEELVLSSSVEDGTEKIGDVFVDSVDATVGTQKSAVLFFNGGGHLGPEYYHLGATNYLAFDNFEVWTPEGPASFIYGDADSDGAVKLSDVSLILKQVAGWSDLTIDLEASDVNVDENVNLTDASAILKYIAGWEGVVLPIA